MGGGASGTIPSPKRLGICYCRPLPKCLQPVKRPTWVSCSILATSSSSVSPSALGVLESWATASGWLLPAFGLEFIIYQMGRGCSTAVEHTPRNLEVVGLNTARWWAFFYLFFRFLLSISSYFPSPVLNQVPQGGASLTVCNERNRKKGNGCLGWNRFNKLRLCKKIVWSKGGTWNSCFLSSKIFWAYNSGF